MKTQLRATGSLVLGASFLLFGQTVNAAVSAEEAAKLSNDPATPLTAIGAEQAANADGTIPAWSGGIIKNGGPPANYKPGGQFVDPFPDDKPLFTINRTNYEEHKDKLSNGHIALFETYDTYTMPVYQSRRSAWYPEEIYTTSIANATTAVLEGSDALKNAKIGFPFPIPHDGNAAAQILWNHKVRYRADTVTRANDQFWVQANGTIQGSKRIEKAYFTYGNIKKPGDIDKDNLLFYYLSEVTAPAKSAGEFTLVHETANQDTNLGGETRSAWIANKGAPRPRRAPNVAYDNPSVGTNGQQFNEQVDMYNGAFDRYSWKLVGKAEMYIPYNSYRISNEPYKYDDLLTTLHFNQEPTRYELHRVWIVEGELIEGLRHSFGHRRIYVDEDSWGITMVELQDTRGALWKFQEGHTINFYNVGVNSTTPEISYDFTTNSYFAVALTNEGTPNRANEYDFDPSDFTASAMKRLLR